MTSKTITLSRPIALPNTPLLSQITLREPSFDDILELGLPALWVQLRDGGGYEQQSPPVIRDYIERLADCDPNYLAMLCARDTLAMIGAVLDFFREAMAPSAPLTDSAPSPDISSSVSA